MEFSKRFRLIAFIVMFGFISIPRLVHTQDQIKATVSANEYYSVSFSGIVDAIDGSRGKQRTLPVFLRIHYIIQTNSIAEKQAWITKNCLSENYNT